MIALSNKGKGSPTAVKKYDAHRKLSFSTLDHHALGIIPLAAGVVTTLRISAKYSVRELIDYTRYF
jgi:hypothetical protein